MSLVGGLFNRMFTYEPGYQPGATYDTDPQTQIVPPYSPPDGSGEIRGTIGGEPVYAYNPYGGLDSIAPQYDGSRLYELGENKRGQPIVSSFTSQDWRNLAIADPNLTLNRFNQGLWQEYQDTGKPFSEALFRDARPSEAQRGYDRALAGDRAEQATKQSFGTAQREIRATGIRADDTENTAFNRKFELNKALNRSDAMNQAELALQRRGDAIKGAAFSADQDVTNTAGRALATGAAGQLNRTTYRLDRDAQRRMASNAAIGQGAGAVVSLISILSHSATKENFGAASGFLDGLAELEIRRWNYIGDTERHVGPMAEDFQRIFGVGDGVTIQLVDVMGVMLGAMKELAERVVRKD